MKRRLITIIATYICMMLVLPAAGRAQNTGERIERSRWFDYNRSLYYGVRLGVNAPQLFFRHMGSIERSSKAGLGVGLVIGRQLGQGVPLFFESGLLYNEKNVKAEATRETQPVTFGLRYLEIPLAFKYKIKTGFDDFSVQPFFGGFIACGVGGKMKLYDERIKVNSFSASRLRRFDAGLRLGCGVAFQNFYFEFSYDIGLCDIAGKECSLYKYDDFDSSIRTGCFSATVGIDF